MTVPAGWKEALALLAVAVLVLRPAFRSRPVAHGDAGEYLLTAESLFNHGTAEVRAADVLSLGERGRLHPILGSYGPLLRHYFPDREGYAYSVHFWAYSAATLPVKAAQRWLGENELKAPQITNGLLFFGVLGYILCRSRLSLSSRRLWALLYSTGPALPFVLWPHPEIYSYALATLGLVFRHEGRPRAATLALSLASLQNPPLALAALVQALGAARAEEAAARRATIALAWLPALLPSVFNVWRFGTPCLMARVGAAGVGNLSLGRTVGLFLDLDVGLLPFVPLTLLVAVFVPLGRLRAGGARLLGEWALLLAMALACTATPNWNHGTSGPSRYGIWLLPFLFDIVVRLVESARTPRLLTAVVVTAGLVQAAITYGRGGVHAPSDHLSHGAAARLVLDRWPARYLADREVFVERTEGTEEPRPGPHLYRAADGRCRKALAQKRHLSELRERCGEPRSSPDFRALVARSGRDVWAYVDY